MAKSKFVHKEDTAQRAKRGSIKQLRADYPSEYGCWTQMKRRCRDTHRADSEHYSIKGIAVAEPWIGPNGFVNFMLDMGPKPGPDYSIERKDNDKGYSKDNCRWATTPEQNRNRSDNLRVTVANKSMVCSELARMCGVHKGSVGKLIHKGMSGDQIFAHFSSGNSRKGQRRSNGQIVTIS